MSVAVDRQLTRDQVEKVRAKLAQQGIVLSGDAGTFSRSLGIGTVAGQFSYSRDILRIEVAQKPLVVGWGTIQSEINKGIDEAITA